MIFVPPAATRSTAASTSATVRLRWEKPRPVYGMSDSAGCAGRSTNGNSSMPVAGHDILALRQVIGRTRESWRSVGAVLPAARLRQLQLGGALLLGARRGARPFPTPHQAARGRPARGAAGAIPRPAGRAASDDRGGVAGRQRGTTLFPRGTVSAVPGRCSRT